MIIFIFSYIFSSSSEGFVKLLFYIEFRRGWKNNNNKKIMLNKVFKERKPAKLFSAAYIRQDGVWP